MRLKKSESQFLYLRNSAIKFENGKMKNGFSICNFPIKIGNWKLTNFYHLKWKLKFAKISFFISILNWKLNGTFDAQSVSQKGHSIFVLKWNRVLIFFFSFFVFIIKSKNEFQIPISIFNKNWKMNFCSFFHEIFFAPKHSSDQSHHLNYSYKNESLHLFSIFQKIEYKTLSLIFV